MPFKLTPEGTIAFTEVNGAKLPVYVHPDGKESPFDADGTLGTISRLNGEAKSHRERAEAAEKALKGFDGISDPAEALKAMQIMKNLDDKRLVDAGEVDKVKTEAIKAVEEKYAPIVQRAQTLEQQLTAHMIGGGFSRSKFIAEKFAAEGPAGGDIAQALFAQRFKVEDGRVVGYDASGNKLYSRAKPGEIAEFDEALEMMVDAYPHKAQILRGSGASGSGAQSGGGGAGGAKQIQRAQFDSMSQMERARFAKEGGKVVD